ncbi:hypothetical protein B0T17DRAFT_218049 [Bombardia bombarda]|uniref:Secreted protein n=1 Tax=Bombardia bombarda TaxID=252184 RepID=A0AA39XAS9_9PEZI|nr:hypothetical protein B0T17DRAFT_218049 [Bombardia bombarda]
MGMHSRKSIPFLSICSLFSFLLVLSGWSVASSGCLPQVAFFGRHFRSWVLPITFVFLARLFKTCFHHIRFGLSRGVVWLSGQRNKHGQFIVKRVHGGICGKRQKFTGFVLSAKMEANIASMSIISIYIQSIDLL